MFVPAYTMDSSWKKKQLVFQTNDDQVLLMHICTIRPSELLIRIWEQLNSNLEPQGTT